MNEHLNHNTRRQLFAIAKRNREDAETLAKIHMELILRDGVSIFVHRTDAAATMLAGIQQAKTQAATMELFLKNTDPEAPAIDRKN